MKTTGKITLGILAGLGVAASAAVLAHGHGPMMGHDPMMGHGPMAKCMAGGPEARLSTLKTELKLTAKQESAWQAFEKTVREQVASHGPGPAGTTAGTDPMQARIAFMEQRLAGMKAVAKARADLYTVLTPEQKAVADRLMSGPRG
jgi:Spy/CpxP family protein refolding chaperone